MSLTKWLLRLFGLALVAFLVYAWTPAFNRYHYILLEGAEGVGVVERAEVSPPMIGAFIGTIPTRYQAERPGYTILFNVPEHGQGSALIITATPPGVTLQFEEEGGSAGDWCGRGEPWETFAVPPNWIFNAWRCAPERERTHRVMRFDVLDADGNVLGREAIPYRRVTDGFYFYLDLL
ncbi:MAG: hypothetical protein HZA24_12015 [Nitrospirae bacterium]|nr:hypothetical protein [Nitrospirota bacterium]